jgi:hypothetical protein
MMVLMERLKSRNGNRNLPKKLQELLTGYLANSVEHVDIRHEMPEFVSCLAKGLGIGSQPEKVPILPCMNA